LLQPHSALDAPINIDTGKFRLEARPASDFEHETKVPTRQLDIAARVQPMSAERGLSAAMPSARPVSVIGALGVLVLLDILRLVILLGWRDEGRPG
jgi:hypothetical protein